MIVWVMVFDSILINLPGDKQIKKYVVGQDKNCWWVKASHLLAKCHFIRFKTNSKLHFLLKTRQYSLWPQSVLLDESELHISRLIIFLLFVVLQFVLFKFNHFILNKISFKLVVVLPYSQSSINNLKKYHCHVTCHHQCQMFVCNVSATHQ